MHRSPWLAAILLAVIWGARAGAQPGGTVEGAVQYRSAAGTFAADDNIKIVSSPGFQLLNGKLIYIHQPTASDLIQVIDFGTAGSGALTALQVDGSPSNDVIISYPVSGRSGTPNVPVTVLFREDLDSVAELSTRIGADSTAANRFLASPSGASGALSLRALANADLSGLSPTFAGLTLSTGTTNGLLHRNSSGGIVSSSKIGTDASSTFLELKGGAYLKQTDPIAQFLMQTVFTNPSPSRTVNLALDGQPDSGTTNIYFPVIARTGTFHVLFTEDLDEVADLDSIFGSTGDPAPTNFLSGGNAWLNLGTLAERTAAPATPASGFGELWIDTAGEVHVIDDGGGIHQIIREPTGGITTGQVPVKQADGSYAGSTLSDGHDALSLTSRSDDVKSHSALYALAQGIDVDTMPERSGHPDQNVACKDPSPGPDETARRRIRTHGGILWEARVCTDTVGTSRWQPINEVYLGHYFTTAASTATGCVSFASNQAGQLAASCNTDATSFVFRRDFLLTRVVARDTAGATNNAGGSPCKVQLWKNAAAADPNTDGADGTKLLTNDDTTSMAGTTTAAKTWAIWDSASEPKADWTFDFDDRLDIEFDDATCDGNNKIQLMIDLWGVPLG